MKVALVDTVHPDLPKGLKELGFTVVELFTETDLTLIEKLQSCVGIIIRSRFPLTRDFLVQLPNLQFIGRVGAGLENIDEQAAEELNIQLFSAPEGNRNAVAEHALGMLLMLFNNLKKADTEVRNGKWLREENRGVEVEGKTIGIIGFGNMGSAFARKLRGFDVKILAYDKYKTGFGTNEVEEVDLKTLQKNVNVLSLHIPQTEETIGMVNDTFISAFSKPFYLINTARGKVVQTEALVNALKSGKLLGACLDVLEYEKASFESMFAQQLPTDFTYLTSAKNVLLSPHIAGWTVESNQKMAQVLLSKIANREKS